MRKKGKETTSWRLQRTIALTLTLAIGQEAGSKLHGESANVTAGASAMRRWWTGWAPNAGTGQEQGRSRAGAGHLAGKARERPARGRLHPLILSFSHPIVGLVL
jgi:hypothetical protein